MKTKNIFIVTTIVLLIYIFRKQILDWLKKQQVDSSGSSTGILTDAHNLVADKAKDFTTNLDAVREVITSALKDMVSDGVVKSQGLYTDDGIDNTLLENNSLATRPMSVDDLLPDSVRRDKRDTPNLTQQILQTTLQWDKDRQKQINEILEGSTKPEYELMRNKQCTCGGEDCSCQINIYQISQN